MVMVPVVVLRGKIGEIAVVLEEEEEGGQDIEVMHGRKSPLSDLPSRTRSLPHEHT